MLCFRVVYRGIPLHHLYFLPMKHLAKHRMRVQKKKVLLVLLESNLRLSEAVSTRSTSVNSVDINNDFLKHKQAILTSLADVSTSS